MITNNLYTNNSKSINDIVKANTGYVIEKAVEYSNKYNLPYDECFSEGQFGLAEAACHFDPTRGFKLLTYAGCYIEGRMKRLLNKEIRRRNRQAEDSFDTAIICLEDSCRADSEVGYIELLQLIQQYVDARYYPGVAQEYLEVIELVSAGYKEREAVDKCNMEPGFFKRINGDVRKLLQTHHYHRARRSGGAAARH